MGLVGRDCHGGVYLRGAHLRAPLQANLQAHLWANLRAHLRAHLRANLRANLWANLRANLWAHLWAHLQAHLWAHLWVIIFYRSSKNLCTSWTHYIYQLESNWSKLVIIVYRSRFHLDLDAI